MTPPQSSVDAIASMSPQEVRHHMPRLLAEHVYATEAVRAEVCAELTRVLGNLSDAEIASALATYRHVGESYDLFSGVPVARTVMRSYMGALVPDMGCTGVDHLQAGLAHGKTLLVCNHLSYADTQLTDFALHNHGAAQLAEKLVVIAGPKVYEHALRRLAAFSLTNIKTAQSATLGHNVAGLSPQAVGRIAVETLRTARRCMEAGHAVVLYAEGARSRTHRLQPFLKATAKYVALADVVVPTAIIGTHAFLPMHEHEARHGAKVGLAFGPPIPTQGQSAADVVEGVWQQVANLLPPEHKPQKKGTGTFNLGTD